MRFTRYGGLEWRTRPDMGRSDGRSSSEKTRDKRLQHGAPGLPGHFEMAVATYPAVKQVKRHRHGHDQLRLSLKGSSPWAPGAETPEGSLLFIPSGTAYGPYDRPAGIEILSVEFEGENRAPFVDFDQMFDAHRRLADRGRFDGGVYYWTDESGSERKMQAGRARMEEATGLPQEFPRPRFSSPIEIHPGAFARRPFASGVSVRPMLSLGTGEFSVSMFDVDPSSGLRLVADQPTLLFVVGGVGRWADEAIGERDSLYLEASEAVVLEADEKMTILEVVLPVPRVAQ